MAIVAKKTKTLNTNDIIGGTMAKQKKTFTAHIGEPQETLVTKLGSSSVLSLREITVKNRNDTIATFQAADSEADIRARLLKNGFNPGVRTGDTMVVTRKNLTGSQIIAAGVFGALLLLVVVLYAL